MSAPLIKVTRGNVVECIHRGDVVAVSSGGEIIFSEGDPNKFTYFRSSSKPIQGIQVILSGADKEFGLSESEIAVICSSHYAEEIHLQAVASILKKIGLDESYLNCGAAVSLKQERSIEMALNGIGASKIISDCSGKHAGMLAVCKKMGYSLKDYLSPNHPLQKSILNSLSEICNYPSKNIEIGTDGCSAPVFAMPIFNMALGFARFASLDRLPEKFHYSAEKIYHAMTTNPEYISGTGGFCSDLIKSTNGKLIGKIGAEGVYCVGVKDQKVGIAIKIEDGNMRALPPVVIETLKKLNLLTETELTNLSKYHIVESRNDKGEVVGFLSSL